LQSIKLAIAADASEERANVVELSTSIRQLAAQLYTEFVCSGDEQCAPYEDEVIRLKDW